MALGRPTVQVGSSAYVVCCASPTPREREREREKHLSTCASSFSFFFSPPPPSFLHWNALTFQQQKEREIIYTYSSVFRQPLFLSHRPSPSCFTRNKKKKCTCFSLFFFYFFREQLSQIPSHRLILNKKPSPGSFDEMMMQSDFRNRIIQLTSLANGERMRRSLNAFMKLPYVIGCFN